MKHIRLFLVTALVSMVPLVAMAAAKKPETPDVKAALTEWVAAIETGDSAKVVSLYDKDSVMLSAFAINPITTEAGLKAYFDKVVAEPDINIDVTGQDVRMFGNVAVNTGLYNFHWTQDGEPMDEPARFTFVYVLKNGKWSIISHHSSRVPLPQNK